MSILSSLKTTGWKITLVPSHQGYRIVTELLAVCSWRHHSQNIFINALALSPTILFFAVQKSESDVTDPEKGCAHLQTYPVEMPKIQQVS